ncbi:MAG: phenylalanine--tRNA ligase subunit alpha [Clostridiales bacterium]|nr:phenylalanine--tRNA ligase subunit alpha [Clostridiales bacterium]
MQEKFDQLKQMAKDELLSVFSTKNLFELKTKYVGKNGEITALLRGMKDVPASERANFGKMVNDLKVEVSEMFNQKEIELKEKELAEKFESESVDVTLPGKINKNGSLHPLNLVKNKILDAFCGMGFEVFEGPEIDTDYYCFQALNIPKDHPARDMQDTFYITDNVLLRPHTSPGQVRTMEKKAPPIKILSPGRVYRADDDASHSPMFHQIEGLVVDKGVSLCDLKGLLDEFVRIMFDEDTKTRFRPSYFPFTEPSVEVDVTCCKCHGKGCSLCKGTGWIEILGAGVVNKKVLEMSGIDSNVYSGLAFGMGIERITMIKYGISDIRTLFENNVKFLKQFNRR